MLKFPPNQRLANAEDNFNSGNLDDAEKQIRQIQRLFPNSSEAKVCVDLLQKIESKRQLIIAEEKRIKALGFKALTPVSNTTIDGTSVSFSGFSIGKDFIHDAYSTYSGSEWFYNTANKGNKYITASMSATSNNSNPDLPTLGFYSVEGDKLFHQGTFKIEFARWDDYGTYLGNEPDFHNDFAKVNTVKFKLGCELPERILSKSYIVVIKLENTQSREYDRFGNPPYSYKGNAKYPSTLTIDDFKSNYKAVKIANL